MAQTDKNKRFFLPHLLLASVYYGAKPADRWRLILANVKEWISVPYLSLLISQPEAQAGLFSAWQVYASPPDFKIVPFFIITEATQRHQKWHNALLLFCKLLWTHSFGDFHLPSLNLNLVSWLLDFYKSQSKPVISFKECQIPRWLTFFGFYSTWMHELCCPFFASFQPHIVAAKPHNPIIEMGAVAAIGFLLLLSTWL